jgi:hypothetical protein
MGNNSLLIIALTLSGAQNGAHLYPTFIHIGSDHSQIYSSTIEIPRLTPEQISWAISFYSNTSPRNTFLGICGDSFALDDSAKALACNLQLSAPSAIVGRFLSLVGLNVYSRGEGGQLVPESQALISLDDSTSVVGITGNFAPQYPGFTELSLNRGNYTLRVKKGALHGSVAVSLEPLQVEDVDVILE